MFKRKGKKVDVKVNSDELSEALQVQRELVMFYQKGFIDGYAKANDIKLFGGGRSGREEKLFKRIEPDARRAFDYRFMKNIKHRIKVMRRNL